MRRLHCSSRTCQLLSVETERSTIYILLYKLQKKKKKKMSSRFAIAKNSKKPALSCSSNCEFVVTRRDQRPTSAVFTDDSDDLPPPPVVLEAHPLQKLSTRHMSSPSLALSREPPNKSGSVCQVRGTRSDLEEEEDLYSHLSRDQRLGRGSNASPTPNGAYSQLNFIEDASLPSTPACDGYTYIDIDDSPRLTKPPSLSNTSNNHKPVQKPEHYYFVLEIPEQSSPETTEIVDQDVNKENFYFTLEEQHSPPSNGVYYNITSTPPITESPSPTNSSNKRTDQDDSGVYSYVEVNMSRIPVLSSGRPSPTREPTPEAYEQPVEIRKKYKPLTIPSRKRMGVIYSDAHTSPFNGREIYSRLSSKVSPRSSSTSPQFGFPSDDNDGNSEDHIYSRTSYCSNSPVSTHSPDQRDAYSSTFSSSPRVRRICSDTTHSTTSDNHRLGDNLQQNRSSTMADLSPDRCGHSDHCHSPYNASKNRRGGSLRHERLEKRKTADSSRSMTPPHSSHVNLIITADGPILVPSDTP